jgi:hypothetical protein
VSESVQVSVSFEWAEVGRIGLDEQGKLGFPSLPREPGVYKLAITEADGSTATYIGEADELRRRFTHYRNPGPNTAHEQADQRAVAAAPRERRMGLDGDRDERLA